MTGDAELAGAARPEPGPAAEPTTGPEDEHAAEAQARWAVQRAREVELLAAVAMIVNEADDALSALSAAAKVIRRHCGFAVSHVLVPDEDGAFVTSDVWDADSGQLDFLDVVLAATVDERFLPPRGLPGEVAASHLAAWLPDLALAPNYPRHAAIGSGAAWAFPVVTGVEVAAVVEFLDPSPCGADERLLQLAPSLGAQLGHAVDWERLRQGQDFDRRRLEALVAQRTADVAELQRRVRAAGEARGAYAAVLVHDAAAQLRDLLAGTGMAPDAAAAMDRLVAVVEGVARQDEADYEAAGPAAVVAAVVEAYAGAPCAVSAAAPVGDASSDVEIDGPLVARALRALVDNAVRHSGSPAVHVSWSARDALVEIEVRDRGCGVPPDSVPDPPRGAGGLAVAARLAEALGGALEIVERVGGGTLARLRVEGTVSAPATAARRNTQPAATGASRSSRVLLVDDNEVNRRLAAAMLARVGVACDVVDSGAAAHVALASVPYGLVLMDVQMPGMDGREATRVWRRTASGASPADVPVVALTAHVGEEEREACVRAGMDDYLSKPFGLDGLTAVVRRWLDPDQASEPAR